MTYDEKVEIVVQALIEARQFTRKEHFTKLHFGTGNGLDRIPTVQVKDILEQLQDDEKVIEIKDFPTKLKAPMAQASAMMGELVDYFLVDMFDSFDKWYSMRLLKKKQQSSSLTYVNLAKIYDVVLDIEQALQIAGTTTVVIPSMPQIVRFSVLFPGDSIGSRQLYQQYRWEGVKYLEDHGIVSDAKYIQHDFGMDEMRLVVDVAKFDQFYSEVAAEHKKRSDLKTVDTTAVTTTIDSVKDKRSNDKWPNEWKGIEITWPAGARKDGDDFIFDDSSRVIFSNQDNNYKLFAYLFDLRGEPVEVDELVRKFQEEKLGGGIGDVRATLRRLETKVKSGRSQWPNVSIDRTQGSPGQGSGWVRIVWAV